MTTTPDAGPQRLYLIQLGTAAIPTPNGQMKGTLGCYLVQMSDGTNVLIDSGLPEDLPPRPDTPPLENAKSLRAHLAEIGLQPQDIKYVICTHLDVDHAGQHDLFPQAELIIQREQYEVARGGHQRFAPARPHWDHPSLHYRVIEGDYELLPGLELIESSGHAPGHQSVLVRLPHTGPVLLAIDAVPMQGLFKSDRGKTPMDDDEERTIASTRKLLDIAAREHVALTVFHHDGAQWDTLKKAPAFYD